MVRNALAILCAVLLLGAAAGPAGSQSGWQWGYVEQTANGTIDWGDGNITVTGIGAAPQKYRDQPAARPMAIRAAKLDAYRNLLEVTKGVQVTSETRVEDFMTQSDVIHSTVDGLVKGARILDTKYLQDGTVEVIMVMNMYGRFTDTMLGALKEAPPQKAAPVTPPVTPAPTPATPAPTPTPTPATPAPTPVAPVEEKGVAQPGVVYTGLVIDARGLGARPCMSPKVMDEDGREVYGSAYVDREWAVQYGMVGYAKDVNAAQSNQRVTNHPLTVKALSTTGPAKTNIVISNEAADSLRKASETLSFLKQCRAMFVLD